jgi:hypothetical protein
VARGRWHLVVAHHLRPPNRSDSRGATEVNPLPRGHDAPSNNGAARGQGGVTHPTGSKSQQVAKPTVNPTVGSGNILAKREEQQMLVKFAYAALIFSVLSILAWAFYMLIAKDYDIAFYVATAGIVGAALGLVAVTFHLINTRR